MTFPSVSDICRATADGDLTLVKILVSRGAPVDSLCQAVCVRGGKHFINGWPPVRVAAKFSQYRVLQFLLDLGTVDTNRLSLVSHHYASSMRLCCWQEIYFYNTLSKVGIMCTNRAAKIYSNNYPGEQKFRLKLEE